MADANGHTIHADSVPKADKQKPRKPRKGFPFRAMTKKIKIILVIALIVVIVILTTIIPGLLSAGNEGITVSEATLKDAVSISKLSTAEFSYNGIAEKTNDRGDAEYHIYYEAKANAGIDMEQIKFNIDENQRVITVILPRIAVDSPVIDESAIEFLPANANVDLREVVVICKEDVRGELEQNSQVREVAEGNLKSTLEALLTPIIQGEGYTLAWETAADMVVDGDSNEANQ